MLETMKRIPTAVRRAVYQRDDFRCVLCFDNRSIHVHHIQRRSQGGKSQVNNLVCLCPTCHAIIHGECVLRHQFPFDRDTAMDALLYYMYESVTIDYMLQRVHDSRKELHVTAHDTLFHC